jgi:hypothetical protein
MMTFTRKLGLDPLEAKKLLPWAAFIIFAGMATGFLTVLSPALAASIVLLPICGVLIWSMPELRSVPLATLRRVLYLTLLVQLCVPAYYAIRVGDLPWISLRRLCLAVTILLFFIVVGGSRDARRYLAESMRRSRWLAVAAVGFFVMLVLSIPTSAGPATSVKQLSDVFLTWFVPLSCTVLAIRTMREITVALRLIMLSAVIVTILGIIEFKLQRNYYFDLLPRDMLDQLMADNPFYKTLFDASIRNGLYRAASIFSVPLSFAQFGAMVSPIAAGFILHAGPIRYRLLGVAALGCGMVSLYISGSRGGVVSFIVGMSMMYLLVTLRYVVTHRREISAVILLTVNPMLLLGAAVAIFASRRIHNMVLGGGTTQASTDARFIERDLAAPHIWANPITGHGLGMANEVINYIPSGYESPTVDSYILTLLVETGVPGFLCFFGMIAYAVIVSSRIYIFDKNPQSTLVAGIGCSLLAFAIYLMVLSQRENHTLAFILVGLFVAFNRLYQQKFSSAAVEEKRKSQSAAPRPARA